MKRFLTFTALYPPLLLFGVLLFVREARGPFDVSFMLWMLGIAYLVGIVPALVSAVVDWGLSAEPIYIRLPIVTVVGVGVTMAAIVAIHFGEMLRVWTAVAMIALISGIPAAICSWLSGPKTKQA